MRVRRHRAIKDLAKVWIGLEKIWENRFAVDLVPCGLAGLDTVEQLAVNAPMRLFAYPNGQVARASRVVRTKRLAHWRILKYLFAVFGKNADTGTRPKQTIKRTLVGR